LNCRTRIVEHPNVPLGFVMQFSKDLICGFNSSFSFQKIQQILTNSTNPHKSWVHWHTLDKLILNFWICKSVCSLKELFADSFRDLVFKRFICGFDLWCGFQKIQFGDSFGQQKSKNIQFVRIRNFWGSFNICQNLNNLMIYYFNL
jgi:hypothetical protein